MSTIDIRPQRERLCSGSKINPPFVPNGDVWTLTAIDAETKIVPSWLVGLRDVEHASIFINDLKERLTKKIQITSDSYKMYLNAVEGAFGSEVDYAMLFKLYGVQAEGEKWYSFSECKVMRNITSLVILK